MNLKDAIFKTTTTALGACTLVFGISFIASLASGFSYHLQESTEKVNNRSDPLLLPPFTDCDQGKKREIGVALMKSDRLLFFNELPPVLQFNKYIWSGYRAGYSYPSALRSIFALHNETGNIWSHLIPAIILLNALKSESEWIFTGSAVICLAASVSYHTCMACHRHYRFWLKVDVLGIYVLMVAGQFQVFSTGLPCHPRLAVVIKGIYALAASVGILFSLEAKSPIKRGLPMLILMAIRISFLALRLYLDQKNMAGWTFHLFAEAMGLLGGIINAFRVPERLIKNRRNRILDYWMNSHQMMHIFVVIAVFSTRMGLKFDLQHSSARILPC